MIKMSHVKANSIAYNWSPLGFFFDSVSHVGDDKDLREVKREREMTQDEGGCSFYRNEKAA